LIFCSVFSFLKVFTVDEPDDDYFETSEDLKSEEEEKSESTETNPIPENSLISSSEWNWEMSLEDRWTQCQLLEEKFWILVIHYFSLHIKNQLMVTQLLKSLHCLFCLYQMVKCEEVLKKQLEVARRKHHDAKVRANTKVYENKAVIGGTIVGCITRLEAIRY
jgi:hypothetical protein